MHYRALHESVLARQSKITVPLILEVPRTYVIHSELFPIFLEPSFACSRGALNSNLGSDVGEISIISNSTLSETVGFC
jgi:hypothetical protein